MSLALVIRKSVSGQNEREGWVGEEQFSMVKVRGVASHKHSEVYGMPFGGDELSLPHPVVIQASGVLSDLNISVCCNVTGNKYAGSREKLLTDRSNNNNKKNFLFWCSQVMHFLHS